MKTSERPVRWTGKCLDISGQRFGQLLAVAPVARDRGIIWLCRCDCGKESRVKTTNLRSGHIKSCGCSRAISNTRHGARRTPEYAAYCHAKARCENPNNKRWADYGGRGIQFRFAAFEDFLAALGPRPSERHSVDRKDANGHYEPSNVRWATAAQQSVNKRTNRLITFAGMTLTLTEWARRAGIPQPTLHRRISVGWSLSRALNGFTP